MVVTSYQHLVLSLAVHFALCICLNIPAQATLPKRSDTKLSKKTLAKKHFTQAKQWFAQGKYNEALAEYENAYAISPLPGFLFNIAQCHRNMHQYEKATHFFELYLEKMPEAQNRTAVEALLADLRAKIDQNSEPHRKKSTPPIILDPDLSPETISPETNSKKSPSVEFRS